MDYSIELMEQIAAVLLVSLAINLASYVVTTAGIFYALSYFWKKGLEKHKIQQRQASRADIRREILYSLRTVVVLSVIYSATYFGVRVKFFTVYPGIQPLGVLYLVGSIVALVVVHDTYFYWFHRMMHHRLFFRRFHRTHHKSITPTVYSCYAFDLPEALLIGAFMPLWLLAIPMQLPGLLIPATLLLIKNAMIHCGVELFAWVPESSRWFGWLATNTDHDLHHSTVRYNYGFLLRFWDRVMGTEYPVTHDQVRGRLVAGAKTANQDR